MAIDVRRVLEAALEAAIQDPTPPTKPKKRRLSSGRALLLGAGIVTAGRVVAGAKGREMLGHLQQRIADMDWDGDQELDDAAEYEEDVDAQADEAFEPEEEDEELAAEEGDEELEAEEDEDESEDEEQEPLADADEDSDDGDIEPDPPRARRGRSRGRGRG